MAPIRAPLDLLAMSSDIRIRDGLVFYSWHMPEPAISGDGLDADLYHFTPSIY